ncbi:hypothetical protein Tco_0577327, partial [Tanacetum coccineum]
EFGIDSCSKSFKFLHQYDVIGIDVASTSEDNGFRIRADLGFT